MHNSFYTRAHDVAHVVRRLAADSSARIIAGGTNLINLMKYNVEQPTHLIDITHLPLHTIEDTDDGGLRIGALVTNTAVAHDERVAQRYPLLAQAILAGASPQLRNVATTGGNLLQRTRCYYFTTRLRPAINVNLVLVAVQSMDTIAFTPFWAPANIASRSIQAICVSRSPPWTQGCM